MGTHECGSTLTKSGKPCRVSVWDKWRYCWRHAALERHAACADLLEDIAAWLASVDQAEPK